MAVRGYDMTVEAAVTKLNYLFSMGYDFDTVKTDGNGSARRIGQTVIHVLFVIYLSSI